MNFTIKELNELIYSLGISASKGLMYDKELNVSLLNKVYDELNRKIAEEEEQDYLSVVEQDEQRYGDSHCVTNEEDGEDDWLENRLSEDSFPHYVTNEEADEDAFTKVLQSKEEPKKERGWIVQAMLDYVDRKGAATHGQLEDYYKYITNSNSFSHCLINLRVPYKNRKTQRYLAKEGRPHSTAKYVVKTANPSNWVVVDSSYRTFNEAPYGR